MNNMNKKKLTDEDVAAIRSMRLSGVTIKELARKYECAENTIKDVIRCRRRFKEVL